MCFADAAAHLKQESDLLEGAGSARLSFVLLLVFTQFGAYTSWQLIIGIACAASLSASHPVSAVLLNSFCTHMHVSQCSAC
jgi:hypothetical protein